MEARIEFGSEFCRQFKRLAKKYRSSVNNANYSVKSQEEIPNTITLAAMKEIESCKDAGPVCMDNLESFIASMQ